MSACIRWYRALACIGSKSELTSISERVCLLLGVNISGRVRLIVGCFGRQSRRASVFNFDIQQTMASKEHRDSLLAFQKDLNSEALDILNTRFPTKVLKLNGLLDDIKNGKGEFALVNMGQGFDGRVRPGSEFDHSKLSTGEATLKTEDGPSKKRKLSSAATNGTTTAESTSPGPRYDEMVKTNAHIAKLITILKAEFIELVDSCDRFRLWVNLKMPRIEDGDNFGVQIQEETLAELSRAQETGYNFMESITKYYFSRAKLCGKLIKYPHVEDYHYAVKELDSKVGFVA